MAISAVRAHCNLDYKNGIHNVWNPNVQVQDDCACDIICRYTRIRCVHSLRLRRRNKKKQTFFWAFPWVVTSTAREGLWFLCLLYDGSTEGSSKLVL